MFPPTRKDIISTRYIGCIEIKVVYVVNVNNISGLGVMELNATFNNIAVISWRSVLLVEETGEPEKHNEQPQVTDKFYHIMLYRYEQDSNSQLSSFKEFMKSYKHWHIRSTERYTVYMQGRLECCYINETFSGKI
jgi:hypothetical protein